MKKNQTDYVRHLVWPEWKREKKIYQVKQLKENSTENSAEKNFTEDSKLNENWNISTKLKKKKKKKYPKNFVSRTFSQISACKLH